MRITLVIPCVLAVIFASVIGFEKYQSYQELAEWNEQVFSQAIVGDTMAVITFKLDSGELVSETPSTQTYRHGQFQYVIETEPAWINEWGIGRRLTSKERLPD